MTAIHSSQLTGKWREGEKCGLSIDSAVLFNPTHLRLCHGAEHTKPIGRLGPQKPRLDMAKHGRRLGSAGKARAGGQNGKLMPSAAGRQALLKPAPDSKSSGPVCQDGKGKHH